LQVLFWDAKSNGKLTVVSDLLDNLSLPGLVLVDLLPPSCVWKSVATAAAPAEDETGDIGTCRICGRDDILEFRLTQGKGIRRAHEVASMGIWGASGSPTATATGP
jgi:hypothetical protein